MSRPLTETELENLIFIDKELTAKRKYDEWKQAERELAGSRRVFK